MSYNDETPEIVTRPPGTSGFVAKKSVQNAGSQIMQLADVLRPIIARQLRHCYDENGMPVQPARERGIALIVAQDLIKSQLTHEQMADWMNPAMKHRVESIIYEAFLKAGLDSFTQPN